MTTSSTLADLRVLKPDYTGHGLTRPATREDILAVLGGTEVWWCQAHRSRWNGPHEPRLCQYAELYPTAAPYCRLGPALIVPIEES